MGTARAQSANKGSTTGKQRLWLVAALLLVLLAVAAYLSVASFGGNGLAGAARAAISKARSVAELLNLRSPGKRTDGELVKLKHRHARLHERALPKVVYNLPFPAFEHPATLIDILAAPPLTVPPGLDKTPLPPISEAPPTGSGPPIILPPGEGPPFGPPVIPPPGPPPPPPPRVPEPATWMTMLLGFALIGCLLRGDAGRARAR